jgi:hypothetical protein
MAFAVAALVVGTVSGAQALVANVRTVAGLIKAIAHLSR